MTRRERREIARELRGLRLIGGGQGCVFLCTRRGLIISKAACLALERAAFERGFSRRRPGWNAVVEALAKKALRPVIDDAIRELRHRAPAMHRAR